MPSDLPTFDVPTDVEAALNSVAWTLDVVGAVERDLRLRPSDLLAMDQRTVTDDVSCAEGWVARDLSWRGVPVADVLDRARPDRSAAVGLVRGADGAYAAGFELDRLRASLLAVELDGEPLPVEHGGPIRLVPAGPESDCWEGVKWVSRIDLSERRPPEADAAERIARSRTD